MEPNMILAAVGGLVVLGGLVAVVLVKKRTAYLGPVKEELQKEKMWLRRGEYNAAMVKGRQNLELLWKLVAEKNGIQLDNSAQAVANAREEMERESQKSNKKRGGRGKEKKVMTHQQFNRWLSENGYLDRVARWEMNQVRLIGNKAVHENYADKDDAWNQYNYLEDILKTVTEKSQNPKKHHERKEDDAKLGVKAERGPKAKHGQKEQNGQKKEKGPKEQGSQKKEKNPKEQGNQKKEKNPKEQKAQKLQEIPKKNVAAEAPDVQVSEELEQKKKKRRRRKKKAQNAPAEQSVQPAEVVEKAKAAEKNQQKPAAENTVTEKTAVEKSEPLDEAAKAKKRRRRKKKPQNVSASGSQAEQPTEEKAKKAEIAEKPENLEKPKKKRYYHRRRRPKNSSNGQVAGETVVSEK